MPKFNIEQVSIVQCIKCTKIIRYEDSHRSFAGYRYCRRCWPKVGLRERIFGYSFKR
jgi:hypothetical protein